MEMIGFKIKEGVIQDATFITADPGHNKVDEPRGPEAKTRRNKNGTWTKKGEKSSYGYKLHTKMDMKHSFIREVETTTASVHDSQIDLSQPGEVVYRDRRYFGAPCKGHNATMGRNVRARKITIRQKMRNKRITRKRAPDERFYVVSKAYSTQATPDSPNPHKPDKKHIQMFQLQSTTTKNLNL